MVMAAGLGTRMRPLTNTRPKPLVEVAGKAMIDHCFDKLEQAGVSTVVVNTHYLPDALESHLASADYPFEFRVSDERLQLMETGGGLVQAQQLIDEDIFFSINSDNLWTDGAENSFQRLADDWNDNQMDGLLLLVPRDSAYNYNGAGDFELDEMGRISRRKPESRAPYVWTGIQLLSKRFLRDAPEGPFSTNILWDRAIGEDRLFGIVHDGDWFEVGSPDAIEPTEKALASA
ncbi:nucleotidyltransferase family protein [Parasphingorhabdus halotolerans]|uniref:Nucleotidyltransferase family protein n=2 Tax=Parasphingorhabdus halotolerans TaxID=2725558 RepID=A0A6H2DQJ0_9SPHN|nr:nucleotidyltransferase family protein [Parasphingorhabdus halotolerans]QJB70604.1 nucleotidyltransferase family protein [Parasphingorhabdus halotolerans]